MRKSVNMMTEVMIYLTIKVMNKIKIRMIARFDDKNDK
jgi:hypothetical protein